MKSLIFLDIDGVINPSMVKYKLDIDILGEKNMKRKKKGKKVIDVDSVIRDKYYIFDEFPDIIFPKYAIDNLKRIIQKTKPKLILSSSWRLHPDNYTRICEYLKYTLGIDIFGVTGRNSKGIRGLEILSYIEWLESFNIYNVPYIIIDDDISDIEKYHLEDSIVHVNGAIGLTEDITNEAISKLQKQIEEINYVKDKSLQYYSGF